MSQASVRMWGTVIGAVSWTEHGWANFEYSPDFVSSGIEVSPLVMPLGKQIFSFPALSRESFHGLPGLLADSLPDRFGNALIDSWLASQGRDAISFNPVERLCYTGTRGMGALEFVPAIGPVATGSEHIEVAALVELASSILTQREALTASLSEMERRKSMRDILLVGTSAGGARAKAVIAWNSETNEVRSGQLDAPRGFSHWLLKFDGVSGNKDKELEDSQGFGQIEYAYYLMALASGIEMTECRLLEENGRRHFMTRRFDRDKNGVKIHMQSFGALAHYDFNRAGAYSYEQAFAVMRRLELPMQSTEELFRRMSFNVIARNQDDHVKNIAFLMDRSGHWSLSPAFDVVYSYNPSGTWTDRHQMTLNGKRDNFSLDDFLACSKTASMKRGRARIILKEVQEAVSHWINFAEKAGLSEIAAVKIGKTHRRIQ